MKLRLWICLFPSVLWSASHHPQEFLKSIEKDTHQIQKIYQQFCANCHSKKPLIPLGAPLLGDHKAWEKRLLQGEGAVLEHSLNGIGLMPARGGCFECSDEQIKLIIHYMINQ